MRAYASAVLAAALVIGASPLGAQSDRAGTARPGAAKPWAAPRTPDGRPDLQGTWDFRSVTPLERSNEFADKDRLTEQEAAEFVKRSVDGRVDRAPRTGDP